MLDYRYCLIRYVPVWERMEPINVGIILQGAHGVEFRFSPHAAKRSDVDTQAFRQWKEFLTTELGIDDQPLFQPPKNAPEFLHHVQSLCQGPIVLSQPLALSVLENRRPEEILDSLLTRLVLPLDQATATEDCRPTGRFRRRADEHDFLKRGMKKYAHVAVDDTQHWTAYRQVLNGQFIAVDKVEVGREQGRTADEIEKAIRITQLLQSFLSTKIDGKATRYVLLADELKEPFAEQNIDEFKAMKDDLDSVTSTVAKAGGQVLRTADQADQFTEELNEKLPQAA